MGGVPETHFQLLLLLTETFRGEMDDLMNFFQYLHVLVSWHSPNSFARLT